MIAEAGICFLKMSIFGNRRREIFRPFAVRCEQRLPRRGKKDGGVIVARLKDFREVRWRLKPAKIQIGDCIHNGAVSYDKPFPRPRLFRRDLMLAERDGFAHKGGGILPWQGGALNGQFLLNDLPARLPYGMQAMTGKFLQQGGFPAAGASGQNDAAPLRRGFSGHDNPLKII